jgi:hypothetical protein
LPHTETCRAATTAASSVRTHGRARHTDIDVRHIVDQWRVVLPPFLSKAIAYYVFFFLKHIWCRASLHWKWQSNLFLLMLPQQSSCML